MPTIRSLKRAIDAIFAETESRCLWFSSGSDSRLLLEVMLETKEPFGILMFPDGWTREQRKQADAVIMAHDLQVFSYPPMGNTLVGKGDDLALVSQYAINGGSNAAMLVRDLVDDPKRCAFDIAMPAKTGPSPIVFETHIWGLRRADRHWISQKPLIEQERQRIGGKEFVFPLAEWSKKDVRTSLKKYYGVDLSGEIDGGDIHCCHNCLKGSGRVWCPKVQKEIDAVEWDRTGNLKLVRSLLDDAGSG